MKLQDFLNLIPPGCASYPVFFDYLEHNSIRSVVPTDVRVRPQNPDNFPSVRITFEPVE